MCFQLSAILTGQGDISEVLVFSQVSKDNFNILMEAIPVVGYWSSQPKGTTKMEQTSLVIPNNICCSETQISNMLM